MNKNEDGFLNLLLNACSFSEEDAKKIIDNQHPYIQKLIAEAGGICSWFHLEAIYEIAYLKSAQYLVGEIAYYVLQHNGSIGILKTDKELSKELEEYTKMKATKKAFLLNFRGALSPRLHVELPDEYQQICDDNLSLIEDIRNYCLITKQYKESIRIFQRGDYRAFENYDLCMQSFGIYKDHRTDELADFVKTKLCIDISIAKNKEEKQSLTQEGYQYKRN